MSVVRSISSLVLVTGLGAVLMAQAPALDIKLGLWEQTVVMKMEGVPAALPQNVTKSCMTKEVLSSDKFLLEDQPGVKCTRVVTTNTKTSYAANISCTGERPMTGQITIDAATSSAYKGTMKVSSTARGMAMNMTMEMTGKWLAAACGDVK